MDFEIERISSALRINDMDSLKESIVLDFLDDILRFIEKSLKKSEEAVYFN